MLSVLFTHSFLKCFERLFLRFTEFGGSSHSLNLDKFCDTAFLTFLVCSRLRGVVNNPQKVFLIDSLKFVFNIDYFAHSFA